MAQVAAALEVPVVAVPAVVTLQVLQDHPAVPALAVPIRKGKVCS